ncbi:MAG: glucose-1-phosphate cytidylyltransferase [Verrucomicrobiota bacterium]|jgi:glucose-1-phosphate cytidylyltransferase
MKIAILCGGQGTRFREVSEVLPKPMAPIGERPILWHIMKIYAAHGCHEFVLLLGYRGNYIRDFFLNGAASGIDAKVDVSRDDPNCLVVHQPDSEPWRVTLLDTGEKAMTGARLWRARRYLEPEGVFGLTYGDGVGDIDITSLKKFHQSHGKTATLTGVHPPSRFGELTIKGSAVVKFNEKPEKSTGYINGGYFLFNASVFDRFLNDREDLVLEREPLQRMAEAGELMMHAHEGFWHHMDTPHEFDLLNNLWKSGQAPWKIWK